APQRAALGRSAMRVVPLSPAWKTPIRQNQLAERGRGERGVGVARSHPGNGLPVPPVSRDPLMGHDEPLHKGDHRGITGDAPGADSAALTPLKSPLCKGERSERDDLPAE